jgi:hypothetical protein
MLTGLSGLSGLSSLTGAGGYDPLFPLTLGPSCWLSWRETGGTPENDPLILWPDQSGNGRDFDEGVDPPYVFSSGITFDALFQKMASSYNLVRPYTIAVSGYWPSVNTPRRTVVGSDNRLIAPNRAGLSAFIGGAGVSSYNPTLPAWGHCVLTVPLLAGVSTFRYDGVVRGTQAAVTDWATVGLGAYAFTDPGDCVIRQVVIFERVLNATEIGLLEAWMAAEIVLP